MATSTPSAASAFALPSPSPAVAAATAARRPAIPSSMPPDRTAAIAPDAGQRRGGRPSHSRISGGSSIGEWLVFGLASTGVLIAAA